MTAISNAHCPFPGNTFCDTDCMLLISHVDADMVLQESEDTYTKGLSCAFAVLASHVASDKHIGGNWLAKFVSYEEW